MPDQPAIRVGISLCLLGEEVRFDGGHKRDAYLTQIFGKFVQWVPVCPEVEIGLGIPRESIHLVQTTEGIRLRGVRSQKDHTDLMLKYANRKSHDFSDLHGFVFKKDSPSCGMERVRVYAEDRLLHKHGKGMFAGVVMQRMPLLPVEEEGRLNDLSLRENFVERVFCYYRWTEFLRHDPAPAKLVEFHTNHKMTLLSHSPELYRKLGRIVAGRSGQSKDRAGKVARFNEYGTVFMAALQHRATPRKHANCLYHLIGYLKKSISPDDKQELVNCIEEYRQERLPLIVPITLLMHHFRRNPAPWVLQQTYLNPYPSELMLRNHV